MHGKMERVKKLKKSLKSKDILIYTNIIHILSLHTKANDNYGEQTLGEWIGTIR